MLILSALLYRAEGCTPLGTNATLREKSKIFGLVRIGNDFRIQFNSELYELLNAIDFVQRINIQRLRWLGHIVHMEADDPARRVFDEGICVN